MHLKILIGVLTLGIVSASPKAEPKPTAKASPQFYAGGPDQSYYIPVASNTYGQNYAAQSIQGQPSPIVYNVGYAPSNYGYSSPNIAGSGASLYPQTLSGNYYQQPQLIPVPVGYSSASAVNDVQSANYYGAARLWPKTFVSPTGTPSPPLANSAPVYYPSSTPSPLGYQSKTNYVNPLFGHAQIPVTTPAPAQAVQPQLVQIPVKVDSRSSFQPDITNYNTPQRIPVPVSTPVPYLASYQQPTSSAFVQNYQRPTVYPYAAYQQQSVGGPYVAQYQQPTAAPATYQVGYQQQSTPNPYQFRYQQKSYSTPQISYQHSTPAPYKFSYQQQPTPAPYQLSYQRSTPIPPVASYQRPTVSPFSYQQQASYPYVAQYQQPTGFSYSRNYQQPKASPFLANYQRIPVPVGLSHNNFQAQPTKATYTYPVSTTTSYPSVKTKSESVTVQPIPTIPTPIKTVSITEKPFAPLPTTPTPDIISKTSIIKTEYNKGTVSPQYYPGYYNANPYSFPSGNGFVSSNPTAGYLPSTAVSRVSYSGPGASYNY